MRPIERKYRDIDLFHYTPQQRRGFEGAKSLPAQVLAQGVQFEEKETHRIVGVRPTDPQGEIAFPQRGQHVRDRLQRAHDVLPQSDRERKPSPDRQDRQRPLRPECQVTAPEQNQSEGERRDSREERREKDAALVSQTPATAQRSCRLRRR